MPLVRRRTQKGATRISTSGWRTGWTQSKGIRRGLILARKGLGRSADEVFDAIEHDAARR